MIRPTHAPLKIAFTAPVACAELLVEWEYLIFVLILPLTLVLVGFVLLTLRDSALLVVCA